ncbi:MAG: acyl carrier protein [candidate division Zixibacteria bacterium]|nr:acyl carrier protein [candidate division Zixibacteria bacterium]
MKTESRARQVLEELARLLDCPAERLSPEASFHELGVDSLIGMRLIGRLSEAIGQDIDPLAVLDHPSIIELGHYLDQQFGPLER